MTAVINRKVRNFVLLLFVSAVLVGCGPVLTFSAKAPCYDNENAKKEPPFLKDSFSEKLANKFGIMALFSEVAYRRDLKDDGKLESACSRPAPIHFGMPFGPNGDGEWERLRGVERACVNEAGLFYETYVYREDGKKALKEAVIAFRGTENHKGQLFKDWLSNISAAFGFQPKQYRLVREYVPDLIRQLKSKNQGIKIYTVGHSLGGGLAQQVGYMSKDIDEVFTFNTTPVTNWTYLRFGKEVENEYPTIYRLFHGGEFLENVRFVSTNLTTARYGRYDIGVQYEARSAAKGHSMRIIACNFAALIASRAGKSRDAEHYYDPKYNLRRVFGENGPCGVKDEYGDQDKELDGESSGRHAGNTCAANMDRWSAPY